MECMILFDCQNSERCILKKKEKLNCSLLQLCAMGHHHHSGVCVCVLIERKIISQTRMSIFNELLIGLNGWMECSDLELTEELST